MLATAQQLLTDMADFYGDYDTDYQANFFDILDNEICRLCSCNPCQCVDNGGDDN